MGPGPSNPYPEAVAAFTRPTLGHMDPEFLALLDDTMARLRTVFRTANQLTLPIVATGLEGGQLLVEVTHGGKRRTFLVDVDAQA